MAKGILWWEKGESSLGGHMSQDLFLWALLSAPGSLRTGVKWSSNSHFLIWGFVPLGCCLLLGSKAAWCSLLVAIFSLPVFKVWGESCYSFLHYSCLHRLLWLQVENGLPSSFWGGKCLHTCGDTWSDLLLLLCFTFLHIFLKRMPKMALIC